MTAGQSKNIIAASWLAMALLILAIHLPRWDAYATFLTNPQLIQGDARQQILPYLQTRPQADYASTYYRSTFTPIGTHWLYAALSKIQSADIASRYIGLGLYLLTLVFSMLAARALAGPWAALACLAYMTNAISPVETTMQGLPRAFSLPLMAMVLWAGATARWYAMAAAIFLSCLFYPLIGVIAGVWTGCLMLFHRGNEVWSWRPRVTWRNTVMLCLIAAISITLMLLPGRWNNPHYGKLITASMIKNYPEASPTGRYNPPFYGIMLQSLPASFSNAMFISITGAGDPLLTVADARDNLKNDPVMLLQAALLILMGLGIFYQWRSGRRGPAFVAGTASTAVLFCYAVSRIVMPYAFLSDRYFAYSLPVLLPVFMACAFSGYAQLFTRRLHVFIRIPLIVLLFALPVLCFGGDGLHVRNGEAQLHGDVHKLDVPPVLAGTLAHLPPGALLAGWPNDFFDNIAYSSRQPIWLHYETHQAFHSEYTMVMRKRMMLLIDALFSPSPAAVEALRQAGVTHVLIPMAIYDKNEPPKYFSPFNEYMQKHWAEWKKSGHAILALPGSSVLFDQNGLRLVKLSSPDIAATSDLGSHSTASTVIIDAGTLLQQLPKKDALSESLGVESHARLFDNTALMLNSTEEAAAKIHIPKAGNYTLYVRSQGGADSGFKVAINGKKAEPMFGNGAISFKKGGSFSLPEGETEIRLTDIRPAPMVDALVLTTEPSFAEKSLWDAQYSSHSQLRAHITIAPAEQLCLLHSGNSSVIAGMYKNGGVRAYDAKGKALWNYTPTDAVSLQDAAPCIAWHGLKTEDDALVHWESTGGKEWLIASDAATGNAAAKIAWNDLYSGKAKHRLQLATALLGDKAGPSSLLVLTPNASGWTLSAYSPGFKLIWRTKGESENSLPLLKPILQQDATARYIMVGATALNTDGAVTSKDSADFSYDSNPLVDIDQSDYRKDPYVAGVRAQGDMLVFDPEQGWKHLRDSEPMQQIKVVHSDESLKPSLFTLQSASATHETQLHIYDKTHEEKLWPPAPMPYMADLVKTHWSSDKTDDLFWGRLRINPDLSATLYFAEPAYAAFDFLRTGTSQVVTYDPARGAIGVYEYRP